MGEFDKLPRDGETELSSGVKANKGKKERRKKRKRDAEVNEGTSQPIVDGESENCERQGNLEMKKEKEKKKDLIHEVYSNEQAEASVDERRTKRKRSQSGENVDSSKNSAGIEGISRPLLEDKEMGKQPESDKLKKKKKKQKTTNSIVDIEIGSNSIAVDGVSKNSESCMQKRSKEEKKKKKKKKKEKVDNGDDQTKKTDREENNVESGEKLKMKKKKKKSKPETDFSSAEGNSGSSSDEHKKRKLSAEVVSRKKAQTKKRKTKQKPPDKNSSKQTNAKKKRVRFSGEDEVFPSNSDEEDLVRGKRFSEEEDELIRKAVYAYIKEKNLGEDGLDKVIYSQLHPEVRGCWKEIGAALPWRPNLSVYSRGQILFRRSEKRKWLPEELDLVRRYHEENGPKWKEMGQILGKYRTHVKDAWRRNIKLSNPNKGRWKLEEYQSLFDLVNADLRLKAFEEKKTKHGMLRENISWGAISEKMKTRWEMNCCAKWYNQLTSPMVAQGLWADTDDYRLIDELLKLDAFCAEDVDWDSLLEHRSGEISLRRWKQMTRCIGGAKERSFMEQVEILASRYRLDMLEYREHSLKKSAGGGDECEIRVVHPASASS